MPYLDDACHVPIYYTANLVAHITSAKKLWQLDRGGLAISILFAAFNINICVRDLRTVWPYLAKFLHFGNILFVFFLL